MRLEDVFDAALEGEGVLGETEGGVEHPAGGVVEKADQDCLSLSALHVRNDNSVQAIDLHAFQRRGEVELVRLLLLLLVDAVGPLHARCPHQA